MKTFWEFVEALATMAPPRTSHGSGIIDNNDDIGSDDGFSWDEIEDRFGGKIRQWCIHSPVAQKQIRPILLETIFDIEPQIEFKVKPIPSIKFRWEIHESDGRFLAMKENIRKIVMKANDLWRAIRVTPDKLMKGAFLEFITYYLLYYQYGPNSANEAMTVAVGYYSQNSEIKNKVAEVLRATNIKPSYNKINGRFDQDSGVLSAAAELTWR
jgi:hypothetical protein